MVIRIDEQLSQELMAKINWCMHKGLADNFIHQRYIVVNSFTPAYKIRNTNQIINVLNKYNIVKLNKKEWEKEQLKLKMLGVS